MDNKQYFFRGFHPDENGKTTITYMEETVRGDWIYGSLIRLGDKLNYICYATQNQDIRDIGTLSTYVLSKTVGQWVSIDKNGNDVFEGDYVKCNDGVALVHVEEGCVYPIGAYYARSGFVFDKDEWELIGNKWEVAR